MTNARINLFWLIIFGVTLPLGVVLSTHLARRSFEKVKLRDQTIRVKGYAEQSIVSDRAQWSASISRRGVDRTAAYNQLQKDRAALLAFLTSHGFEPEVVHATPVGIYELIKRDAKGNRTNEIEYYTVSQRFTIESTDVQEVAAVANAAAALIAEGINLEADPPDYLYTKLNDLKLEMLARSTANARQRAEKLVSASSNTLGALRSASQGVFQITPAYSNEVSNSGFSDTSSIHKKIRAVVTLEYAIQ